MCICDTVWQLMLYFGFFSCNIYRRFLFKCLSEFFKVRLVQLIQYAFGGVCSASMCIMCLEVKCCDLDTTLSIGMPPPL